MAQLGLRNERAVERIWEAVGEVVAASSEGVAQALELAEALCSEVKLDSNPDLPLVSGAMALAEQRGPLRAPALRLVVSAEAHIYMHIGRARCLCGRRSRNALVGRASLL